MSLPPGPRKTKRQGPPGRRSTSHTASVQPCGPNQRGRCSGLVHASKTRRRGASKTRVKTISRSDGVVTVKALLFFATMFLLLLLHFQQILIETLKTLVKETAIVLHPASDVLERSGLEPAGPPLGFAAAC